MGRLISVGSSLTTVSTSVAYMPQGRREQDRYRDQSLAYRAWYKLARWRKLRWLILVRDQFTCQMCGKLEGDTSKLVADHRHPHRGDAALFWDEGNLQCVCKPCHDSVKQREERAPPR